MQGINAPAPVGFLGGLLYGPAVALVFSCAMGAILALPKDIDSLRYGRIEKPPYIIAGIILGAMCGLPLGLLWGGIIGVLNTITKGARSVGPFAGATLGLLAGLIVASILLWHRFNLDEQFGWLRSNDEYKALSLILYPVVGGMGLVSGLALGWGTGRVMRLPGGFRHRVRYGTIVGAAGGCLAGVVVLGTILLVLAPAIRRYGAW